MKKLKLKKNITNLIKDKTFLFTKNSIRMSIWSLIKHSVNDRVILSVETGRGVSVFNFIRNNLLENLTK